MTQRESCPRCGVALAADTPEGLCPRCLSELALLELEGERDGEPEGLRERLARALPDYELVRFLGRGGMGVVFQARQRTLERTVAIKVVAPASGGEAPWVERFTREARALARLDHPNVVRVYDFGSADGLAYLVLEFVEGANLRELLDGGKLEPPEALAIVPQLCCALQYAHEHGVVHRDVKPENILIDTEGRVKIADFGLAKLAEPGAPAFTATGSALGTLRYMAPEQMDAPGSVDHRADVFSLGVVLYEMLTGHVPAGHFEPPSELVQVDVRVDEVVLRALRREPSQRYQRVSELEEELARAASAPPGTAPEPPPLPEPLEPKARISATRVAHRRQEQADSAGSPWWTLGPYIELVTCGGGIMLCLMAVSGQLRTEPRVSLAILPGTYWACVLLLVLPLVSLRRHSWNASAPGHQIVRIGAGLLVGLMVLRVIRSGGQYDSDPESLGVSFLLLGFAATLLAAGVWSLLAPLRQRPSPQMSPAEVVLRAGALSTLLHFAGLACLFLTWGGGEIGFTPGSGQLRLLAGYEAGAPLLVAVLFGGSWLVRVILLRVEAYRAGGLVSATAGGLACLFTLSRFIEGPPAAGAWLALVAGGLLCLTGLAEWFVGGAGQVRSSSTAP